MRAKLDIAAATEEATSVLQRLIRFDTTNPPGNEAECARWAAGVLESEGIPAAVFEPAPGRGSVVARLPGTGRKRPIVLLSHLDVVPAVAADWEQDPFGGDIVDGHVWGRGALDMKNLAATWMALLLHAKRLGLELDRDLVFVGAADEEALGTWGAKWLVENRPEISGCDYVINEGGGEGRDFSGKTVYTFQTAEKGVCWLRVTASGTAGHASMPHDDNPVVHLTEALGKLGRTRLPLHVTDTFGLFIDGLARALPEPLNQAIKLVLDENTAESILTALPDRYAANAIRAMSRNTATPTVVKAGEKTNVIPQTATAEIDCRILPGQSAETLLDEIRHALGPEGGPQDKLRFEIISTNPATESPPETPLAQAVARAVALHAPDAAVVPFLLPAATDSRFFRERGVVAYGFSPLLPGEDLASVHGKNERISIASLEFGLKVLWDVLMDVAG